MQLERENLGGGSVKCINPISKDSEQSFQVIQSYQRDSLKEKISNKTL